MNYNEIQTPQNDSLVFSRESRTSHNFHIVQRYDF